VLIKDGGRFVQKYALKKISTFFIPFCRESRARHF
jgi:hypothetical protein